MSKYFLETSCVKTGDGNYYYIAKLYSSWFSKFLGVSCAYAHSTKSREAAASKAKQYLRETIQEKETRQVEQIEL